MTARFFSILLAAFLSLSVLAPQGYAQAKTESSGKDDAPFDAKDAFGTILIAGLVGGVLGLSTLAFYDQPNKHVKNITYGAGVGMIGAALYMTLAIAQQSAASEEALLSKDASWIVAPAWSPEKPDALGVNLSYDF
jgi:hypothetical protein